MYNSPDQIIRELEKYLSKHDSQIKSDADFRKFVKKFFVEQNLKVPDLGFIDSSFVKNNTPKTSDDYLELAEEADNSKTALEYAKKALELDQDNTDAAVMIARIESKNPLEFREKLEPIIKDAEKYLKKEKYFKECMGEFWLVFETRPYMRALYDYMEASAHCGMYKRAAEDCEHMLRLCEGDNLGVRYVVISLYVILEDEPSVLNILDRYPEGSGHLLLPASILYYKLGDFAKSRQYLKDAVSANKDTKKFINAMTSMDKSRSKLQQYMDEFDSGLGVRVGTIDEYLSSFHTLPDLYLCSKYYFAWAKDQLKTPRKKEN